MQFAVPQFTEVEDRLIGSLTLKQFFVLLGAGAIILFFWSVLGPSFLFFVISLPIAVLGIGAALGRYNGRPMFTYLMPFAAYLASTKVMVFRREPAVIVSKTEIRKEEKKAEASPEDLEPAGSRLKKLAYLLDRKAHEEEQIVSNDDLNVFKVPPPSPKIDFSKTVSSVMDRTKSQILETAKLLDQKMTSKKTVAKTELPPPAKISPLKIRTATAKRTLPKKSPAPPKAGSKSQPKKFDPSSILQ